MRSSERASDTTGGESRETSVMREGRGNRRESNGQRERQDKDEEDARRSEVEMQEGKMRCGREVGGEDDRMMREVKER